MPVPFLYTLPKTARLWYSTILAGTRRGLSSRAIERAIRKVGGIISRGRSILPLMRRMKTLETQGRAVRFIPKGNVINVNRLPESITLIGNRYTYNVRVVGRDALGDLKTRFSNVTTNRNNLTPGEIEEMAMEDWEQSDKRYQLTDTHFTLVEGMQRAGGQLV